MIINPLYLRDAVVPCTLQDGTTYNARLSGHELWQNMSEEGNCHIWIPFHFLPGCEGDSLSEKLICKKNSELANEMIEDVFLSQNENRLYRLGVALHVYADTWAHREFIGLTDSENEVTGLNVLEPTVSLETRIVDGVLAEAAENRLLGHARAIHWPDRPYVKWTTNERFPSPDGRSNWDEFLEASNNIYKILLRFNGKKEEELPTDKQQLLINTFKIIQIEKCDSRNEEWVKRIKNNEFNFEDTSTEDKNLSYEKVNLLDTLEGVVNDEWKLFFDAIDEHYSFIRASLNSKGINILE